MGIFYNKKYKGLRHYERIRDRLTIREPKEEVKEDCGNSYNATANAMEGLDSIMGLVPLMVTLGIISAGIALVVGGLRRGGLI